jgi:TonB family protein
MTASMLSAAERERLAAAAGGGSGASSLGSLAMTFNSGTQNMASGEPLSEGQVAAVVGRNRPQLRRCYELAVRGNPNAPTVRVSVNLIVGGSGRVTSARVTSSTSVSGLDSCVQGAVRRWVFPSSGGSTPLEFPIVFSGG